MTSGFTLHTLKSYAASYARTQGIYDLFLTQIRKMTKKVAKESGIEYEEPKPFSLKRRLGVKYQQWRLGTSDYIDPTMLERLVKEDLGVKL